MRKGELNNKLREFVRQSLSPTPEERQLVSLIYEAVCSVLGDACFQIGSYARFTAIRPLHDLDVLHPLGAWDPESHDPHEALAVLKKRIEQEFENPTDLELSISPQSHSITLEFRGAKTEFSVDIVPAYENGTNECGEPMYMVPEILASRGHAQRRVAYARLVESGEPMGWLASDPRGYTTAAQRTNEANADFRKAVKLAKAWRSAWKKKDDGFPIKSFHIEQWITRLFVNDDTVTIFDVVFHFFCDIPQLLEKPQIPDRADPDRFIDEYVARLTDKEKELVLSARDRFLVALEELEAGDSISALLKPETRQRASATEAFLFDQRIPVLTEGSLSIVATALERDGFRRRLLDRLGLIEVDRRIQFRLADSPDVDHFKWKVKNDDGSPQPRGEISDHQTLRDPEHTKYRGKHFVECYAIKNGVCVARGRQDVVLGQK